MLRYIRDNKTLRLNYYDDMKDATLSDLPRQVNINTDNQLIVSMILVVNILQTLSEVQDNTLYFINVGKLTMAHMLQD